MLVSLEEAKQYLRLDTSTEDVLLESLLAAAEELVTSILRFPLSEFGSAVPEPVKYAVCFAVSRLYEDRNELTAELLEVLKQLLFAYRKVEW